MATSAELLKAQANGAKILHNSTEVEYSPRHKGDRSPWAYRENTTVYRYMARECVAYVAPVAEVEPIAPAPAVSSEVIEALAVLRDVARTDMAEIKVVAAFNTLDDAGIFSAIDEATGCDIAPAPERVSKCTCPGGTWEGQEHLTGCPGDPNPEPVRKCTCPEENIRFGGHLYQCSVRQDFVTAADNIRSSIQLKW